MVSRKRLGVIALTVVEWIGVAVFVLIGIVVAGLCITLGWVGDPPASLGEGQVASPAAGSATADVAAGTQSAVARSLPKASAEEAASLFAPVYGVLVSPRCMNCHPAGDRPLTDNGVHAMNVSRTSFESGLQCSTCHAERNTELPGAPQGPPGAPHWQLPPRETPMVFQGRTITALCKQLRDPAQNGELTLAGLVEHVEKDPLVLWGWNPGGERTPPPISHAAFVQHVRTWVDAGGICPGEQVAPNLAPEPGTETVTESATETATETGSGTGTGTETSGG